jgi:16S rRNA (guanine966-N2)-methyltransferase
MAERRAAHGRGRAGAPGRIRIIGGSLRGSRLDVPDAPGLRPTADRVRETLFNWLQPVIAGARCLDAFAGTGALGFEAASRGAASVLMLERDPALARNLAAEATRLRASGVRVECTDALAWLARPADRRFDVVFLDPPFASGSWRPAIAGLQPWLAPGARIYVEGPADAPVDCPGWELLREGNTREVRYALYRVAGLQPPGSA